MPTLIYSKFYLSLLNVLLVTLEQILESLLSVCASEEAFSFELLIKGSDFSVAASKL